MEPRDSIRNVHTTIQAEYFNKYQWELLCNIFTENSETCTRIEFDGIVETTNLVNDFDVRFEDVPRGSRFEYNKRAFIKLATEIEHFNCIEVDSGLLGYISDAVWVQKFSNK